MAEILYTFPIRGKKIVAEGAATRYDIYVSWNPYNAFILVVVNEKYVVHLPQQCFERPNVIKIDGLSARDCEVVFEAIVQMEEAGQLW